MNSISSIGHPLKRLVDNLQTLFHLEHAYQVTIIHIAIRAHRNVKFKLLVTTVGKRLANIPYDVTPAQHGTTGAIGDSVLRAQHAYTFRSLHPDLVVRQESVIFSQSIKEDAGKCLHLAIEAGCQISLQATRANIAGHHAHAGDLFENIQDHFAFTETI